MEVKSTHFHIFKVHFRLVGKFEALTKAKLDKKVRFK